MGIFEARGVSMILMLFLSSVFPVLAQDRFPSSMPVVADSATPAATGSVPTAPASSSAASSAAPASFDELMDRVVEKEHLLLAQMRKMRPLVETYLQNLKADAGGNSSPVKDQYFLGRLDMSDGPEDVSFVGQPGFGRNHLNKLTGIFSLRYQP